MEGLKRGSMCSRCRRRTRKISIRLCAPTSQAALLARVSSRVFTYAQVYLRIWPEQSIWTRLILSHAESNCRSVHRERERERGRGWSFCVIIIKVTRAYNHNNGRQPVVRGAAARNERGYPTDTVQCRHTRVRELSLKAKRRAVGDWWWAPGLRVRAPPGNILISKIFAFVFKKRERSAAERSRTRW